jgi:sodium/potassium/calcium exchanger 4
MVSLLLFLSLTMLVLALSLIFYAVCKVCDSYLVPAIEVFIKQYMIPEEVAGVTLIAFGSACPELLLNIVSAQENESALSQPAILGSAMIAFGFIPPLCCYFSTKPSLRLKTRPMLRDCAVYCLALLAFLNFTQDGITSPVEMIAMVGIYVFYVLSVLVFSDGEVPGSGAGADDDGDEEASLLPVASRDTNKDSSKPNTMGPKSARRSLTAGATAADLEFEGEQGEIDKVMIRSNGNESGKKKRCYDTRQKCNALGQCSNRLIQILDAASSAVLVYTIPSLTGLHMRNQLAQITDGAGSPTHAQSKSADEKAGGGHRVNVVRAGLVLACSILHITVLVSLLIKCCIMLLEVLPGVSSTTIGGTIVAFGSQLPDIMSSAALARNGFCDAAMAGAIGSQVINLTLGVALPALSLLITGARGQINLEEISSIGLLTCLVLAVMFFYLMCTVPLTSIIAKSALPEHIKLTKFWACLLLTFFCVSYALFVGINETY